MNKGNGSYQMRANLKQEIAALPLYRATLKKDEGNIVMRLDV